MRRVAIAALLCAACSGLAPVAGQGQRSASARPLTATPPYWFHYPQFTDAEVRLIVNWFQDGFEAKRLRIASIPAAVAHEIHIGAKLTATAVKSLATPPAELAAKLLPLPNGYQRLLAGSVLVILKSDEDLVVDTLPVSGR